MYWCAALLRIIILFTPLNGIRGISLTVKEYGIDNETCLNGFDTCKTLEYVLHNLPAISDVQVNIAIEYDQVISANPLLIAASKALNVSGVNSPTITPADEAKANITVTVGYNITSQLRLSNIHFTNFTSGFYFAYFETISMAKCSFSHCGNLIVNNTANVLFNECQFTRNRFNRSAVLINYDDCAKFPKPQEYTVEVRNTAFYDNAGLLQESLLRELFSVLGVAVGTQIRKQLFCAEVSITILVSNCSFTKTTSSLLKRSTSFPFVNDLTSNQEATAFALKIFRPVKIASLLLDLCTFVDNAASVIDIKGINNDGQMTVRIQDSVIVNNSVTMEGSSSPGLVNMFFDAVLLESDLSVVLTNNSISKNTGAGLKFAIFQLSRNSKAQSINITDTSINETTGPALSVMCFNCVKKIEVHLSETIFANNDVTDLKLNTVTMDNCALYINNSYFVNNTGTGLKMTNTKISPSGLILFDGNRGKDGGGAHFGDGIRLDFSFINSNDLSLEFKNNVAHYGGAVFLSSSFVFVGICEYNQTLNCTGQTIQLIGNSATVAGDDAFLTQPDLVQCAKKLDELEKCDNTPHIRFASVAQNLSFYNETVNNTVSTLEVFPGQDIVVYASVLDAFDNPSTCQATVVLNCGDEYIVCEAESDNTVTKLTGPHSLFLTDGQQISSLQLLSPNGNLSVLPEILFQCEYAQVVLEINVTSCPLGFVYNITARKCECAKENSEFFLCSSTQGEACIAQGYWFGQLNNSDQTFTVVAPCSYSYCTTKFVKCRLDFKNSTDYIVLPQMEDQQCDGNHGGVLCRECTENAYPSFEASRCVPGDKCYENWQAPFLLILAISFQLLLSIILMYFVRYTKSLGVLYGPLFFAAVVNHLPYERYLSLNRLKVIISIFSFYLLNLSAIGQIPLCFIKSLNNVENFAFQLLGPLISAAVMLANVACARQCPRLQKKLQITPIQCLCLLAMLSFWTLADWSIEILKVQTYDDMKDSYVKIQPSLLYFTEAHIPMVILAIFLLSLLVLPFVLVLQLAPLLSTRLNFSRIQPFLDVFQSSFKDKLRWYPAVYFIIWVLFLSSDISRMDTFYISLLFLIIIAIAQLLLAPFRERRINIINSVLLFDLVVISFFVSKEKNYSDGGVQDLESYAAVVLVYILTLTPLILFTFALGFLLLPEVIMLKFSKALTSCFRRKRELRSPQNHEQYELEATAISPPINETYVCLRESLLNST